VAGEALAVLADRAGNEDDRTPAELAATATDIGGLDPSEIDAFVAQLRRDGDALTGSLLLS
jgi:hypothetical protein